MKKQLAVLVVALCLPFSLIACTNEAPAIATGIHGVEVPSDAVVVEQETLSEGVMEADFYEADLSNWEFSEFVEWMEDRLPVGESFDGMDYSAKESSRNDDGHTKSWHWSGLSRTNECHILMVTVLDGDMGEPVKIRIADGTDTPATCTEWLG